MNHRLFHLSRPLVGLLVGVLSLSAARGEDWPNWRGPRGDGSSRESAVPLDWDGTSGRNIRWKVPVPGKGHASPIVSGDRVFLVTCLEETNERVLLCYDARTGRTLWQRTVLKAPLESLHARNTRASGTPATDGERVYVTFLEVGDKTVTATNVSRPRPVKLGKMVVAAYDFDGNQLWLVRPGDFVSVHGYCTCPVIDGERVILNGDHDGESYLVALDRRTGKTLWKTPRQHKTRSYSTPLIRDIGSRRELVLTGSRRVAAFDPESGKRLWSIEGPTQQFVSSVVFDGKFYYLTGGFPTYHVMAVRPGGSGDVTDSHVVWHVTDAKCYVPSPVVLDGYLIVPDDRGTVNCYEAATGKRLWKERLGRQYSASLVTANGLAFLLDDQGTMTAIRPGPQLEVVATNRLGELCRASPAISNGRWYLRGVEHLYCIESKPESRQPSSR